jgi:hypothetical protein
MADREDTAGGQLPGLDKSFQDGLRQVRAFVEAAPFGKLTVLPGRESATAQSAVSVAYPKTAYEGGAVMADTKVFDAVPGVAASDSLTISVKRAGVTTDVVIDLSEVTGTLNLDGINALINRKLAEAGFATRFARVQTGGSIVDRTATWGDHHALIGPGKGGRLCCRNQWR